jgi:hypothetical protein
LLKALVLFTGARILPQYGKRLHLNTQASLWHMGKMTRYLDMSDLLLQDHFLFSLPALPGSLYISALWHT